MMYWNYRVLHLVCGYQIVETHYVDDKPWGYCTADVYGDSVEGLKKNTRDDARGS
jgi:hypothetical protein